VFQGNQSVTKKRVLGAASKNRSVAGTINLVILAAVILWSGCTMPPYDKAAIEAKLQGDRKPSFHELAVGSRTIFYAETGDPSQPPVAFIHGTPGSWMAFGGYLGDDCLRRAAHMIAVDRPGFGRSGYKQVVPSLQEQAASAGSGAAGCLQGAPGNSGRPLPGCSDCCAPDHGLP
jgi:hypothetical protein